ncbi:MAG: DUF1800 family protein [Planctomycetes bacterium]|nr:DUF1800 family protein [Planctomycetota bacterium]
MNPSVSGAKPPPILANTGAFGSELTRRTLLKGVGTGAAALGFGALWPTTAYGAIGGPGGLVPRSNLLMLVNRVSQGYTASELARATTLGYSAYLNSVIAGPATTPRADTVVSSLQPFVSYTPWAYLLTGTPQMPVNPDDLLIAVQAATARLSVRSEHVLLERMMDMWSNRLSVYGRKAGNGALKNYSDYHIIRPHALGSVSRLLTNFARDTSVLYYLDNVGSSAPVPNENWAREFLELYTMGPNDPDPSVTEPNYVEADVQAAAKAFTGWTWDMAPSPNFGLFTYDSALQLTSSAPYAFLGSMITPASASTLEGEQVVGLTVNSSQTARGIAAKMIRHLLRYDPTPAQVTAAAALYPNTGLMVASILSQANISALTPAQYLFSSPSRFAYQALRALDADPSLLAQGLIDELRRMGNAPFEWPAPDGYPDEAEKWLGSVFGRWQFANNLFTAPDPVTGDNPNMPGVVFTDAQLLAMVSPFTTMASVVTNLDVLLTGGILSDNEKSVIEAYGAIAISPPYSYSPYQVLREMFALTISAPSFQYY